MAAAYAGVCLMCGRTVGYVLGRTFLTAPGGRRPERRGRHLRCGTCRGGLIFEPDAALPPEWLDRMSDGEQAAAPPRRAARRRAS